MLTNFHCCGCFCCYFYDIIQIGVHIYSYIHACIYIYTIIVVLYALTLHVLLFLLFLLLLLHSKLHCKLCAAPLRTRATFLLHYYHFMFIVCVSNCKCNGAVVFVIVGFFFISLFFFCIGINGNFLVLNNFAKLIDWLSFSFLTKLCC